MTEDSTFLENDAVYDLLAEWDELRRLGEEPSPEKLCPNDPSLCEQLRSLIDIQKSLNARLGLEETLPGDGPSPTDADPPIIPGIIVEEEVGRGAMAVVYRGRQTEMGRPVAVKVILGGAHAGPLDRARLRTEAIAIARIRHPNIVAIHESGESQGSPYLVLEYLEGGTLAQRLNGQPQNPRWVAELIQTLAGAVAVGHALGVVHRDLKPKNVLFTADGIPKITDFGLAKLLDQDLAHTSTGQFAGTPSYMAPEQAGTGRAKIGFSTDVYALGATLYEACTGKPPFQASNVFETLELVRKQAPISPRRLYPRIPRDLETICMKCLEKDPARRYVDAGQLADELGRFLADLPILARPIGKAERLWRWSRRHPGIAALSMISLALLAVLIIGEFYVARREHRLRVAVEIAEQRELKRADDLAYLRNIEFADRALQGNMVDRCEELLDACPTHQRGWEWHYLQRARGGEERILRGHAERVTGVDFSPDGTRIASSSWDHTAKIWDVASGRLLLTLIGHEKRVSGIAFDPSGTRIATASHDRTVRIWDAHTGQLLHILPGHLDKMFGVAFSADGSMVASVGVSGMARVWNASSGELLYSLPCDPTENLYFVAFNADGSKVAASGDHGNVAVWNLPSRQLVLDYHHKEANLGRGVMFNSADECLAFIGDGRSLLEFVLPESGRTFLSLEGHTAAVTDVAFLGGGQSRLVSSSKDKTLKIWDMATGREMLTLRGHTAPISGVASSPDGHRIASIGEDQTIRIWDATPLRPGESAGKDALTMHGHSATVLVAIYSPDSRMVASASKDNTIRIWDPSSGKETAVLSGHGAPVRALAFDRDSALLASCSEDGEVKLWSLKSGKSLHNLKAHRGEVFGIAFRPDGRSFASSGHDRVVRFWDPCNGESLGVREGYRDALYCIAYSPDGTQGAIGDGKDIQIENWPSGTNPRRLRAHSAEVLHVAFSRDGSRLASASADGTARIWDVATGSELNKVEGHGAEVYCVDFSPDGSRLVTASRDCTVRVWDAATGHRLLLLRGHTDRVRSVAFSPDGTHLVSSSNDRSVKIWNLTP